MLIKSEIKESIFIAQKLRSRLRFLMRKIEIVAYILRPHLLLINLLLYTKYIRNTTDSFLILYCVFLLHLNFGILVNDNSVNL